MPRAGAVVTHCRRASQCVAPCAPVPSARPAAPARSAHQAPRRAAPAAAAAAPAAPELPADSVSVVLLAGGVGKRMGAAIPKQYLELAGQPIATYSLVTFAAMREVGEVVIVCDPSWRYIFEERLPTLARKLPVKWALPGAERQDSVSNGLAQVRGGGSAGG
mgnify:CR=1 FL=1